MSDISDEEMVSVKSESDGFDMDSDSSSDDGSERAESEFLPEVPVYDKRLRNIVGAVKNKLGALAKLMQDHDLNAEPYSSLKDLHQETKHLIEFKIQDHRTVGFIGDSGVGKSSVINSLLDLENFARSGGDGAACTSAVTEFRYIDDTHKAPWTVEVLFLNDEQIKELLEELLRSFRLYHCADDEDGEQDRQSFQEESSRAWTTIQSILPNNEELTEEFLAAQHEGAFHDIMARLQAWASESIARRQNGTHDLIMTFAADDLDGCKHHLSSLMAKSDDREKPPLWPFINIVRVYLDRPILRTGLVLTDLPGFRDLNYARVRATERYMRHYCDEVFIVSSIARCCTDLSIVDIKRRCEIRPQNIICTRSEDISPVEEAHGESDYAAEVCRMNETIKRIEKQIEKTKKSRKEASKREKAKFGERIAELTDKLEDKVLERKKLMVETRNSRVKRQLNELYEGGKVFCVSNRLYAKYQDGDSNQAEAYIELSGISELRQHCYLVPAETQLREVTAFLTNQVPAHLGSLRQWVLSSTEFIAAENASALRGTLDEVAGILHQELLSPAGLISCVVDELIENFTLHILDFAAENQTTWTEQCLNACETWDDFHHNTYAAFCRRNGTFKSRSSTGYRCWNDELTACMREDLTERWRLVQRWLESQQGSIKRRLVEIFQQTCNMVLRHERDAPNAMHNLQKSMLARQRNIAHLIEDFIHKVVSSTMSTCNDMCHGHDSSFMGTVMRPAYLACSNEIGRGSHIRRKNLIIEHVRTASILSTHRSITNEVYTDAINTHFEDLTQSMLKQVNVIVSSLQ